MSSSVRLDIEMVCSSHRSQATGEVTNLVCQGAIPRVGVGMQMRLEKVENP
jgi:hypothetical protein